MERTAEKLRPLSRRPFGRRNAGCTPEVSLRRIRYQVAASLDGYIAGSKGEADWIITDPDIDFHAHFAQFDTVLIGRRTFEGMVRGKKKASRT